MAGGQGPQPCHRQVAGLPRFAAPRSEPCPHSAVRRCLQDYILIPEHHQFQLPKEYLYVMKEVRPSACLPRPRQPQMPAVAFPGTTARRGAPSPHACMRPAVEVAQWRPLLASVGCSAWHAGEHWGARVYHVRRAPPPPFCRPQVGALGLVWHVGQHVTRLALTMRGKEAFKPICLSPYFARLLECPMKASPRMPGAYTCCTVLLADRYAKMHLMRAHFDGVAPLVSKGARVKLHVLNMHGVARRGWQAARWLLPGQTPLPPVQAIINVPMAKSFLEKGLEEDKHPTKKVPALLGIPHSRHSICSLWLGGMQECQACDSRAMKLAWQGA